MSPGQGVVDAFAKTAGVPLVELAARGPLEQTLRGLFGIDAATRALAPASEQRPLHGPFEVATALCYEAVYPGLVADRRGARTRALLSPSSDAWLRDPSTVSEQLTAYASFRAIEQRLPLLRISDAGASVAFDAFGRPRATLPAARSGGIFVEIPPARGLGVVERAGLLLVPFAVGSLWAFGCAAALRKKPIASDEDDDLSALA